MPFDEVNLPSFPVDALPAPVGNYVEALAESTQTPPEMGGVLSLGVMSTAYQRRYHAEVTPDWREPLSIFSVAIAPPADRKSAVITAEIRPGIEWEQSQREIESVEVAQNRTERAILEKALEAAKNGATKGTGNLAEKRAEALELSRQLAEFKDLHMTRLFVDDVTSERLASILAEQNGSITIASAEGGIFDVMAGRYDRQANIDVFLKGHSGDYLSIERVGREANYIPNPHISMILTVQPSVIQGIMANPTFRSRGLCARFLFAMCKSQVGKREIDPAPIPEKIKMEYHDFVKRILSDQGSGGVKLSKEADEIRQAFQAHIEPKLAGELEHMSDWAGKLTGTVVRIAALLHLSSFPVTEPVSAETMMGATSIGEFLLSHAQAAYMVMGANEDQADAKYLWKRIKGNTELSKRKLFNACKGKFRKVENMEPGLNMLSDMGYIRIEEVRTGERGRPTHSIKVNPLAQ